MSLAYITGGQYVPMINAKLLAQVIIGGVREEISLDRLMQAAQEDIDREMRQAEAEGVDDREKAKRVNRVFASKNLHSKQMRNEHGAFSNISKTSYSKCADMSEMRHQFVSAPSAASSTASAAHMDYAVMEDEAVSEEQSERVVQKWSSRHK